jgi:Ubiquitin-activating enzyme E1 FCCH domain
MRIKEVKTFTKGTINSIEDHSIPDGAASDSKNWLTKGDKIELRRGYKVLGTEQTGIGSIDGLHVAFKADGTQILYRKRGRKLEYYDTSTSDWVEVGTNLFPVGATTDEVSFANYASLAGNQLFICSPNSGPYKIMTANPGSYTDLTDSAKNFQGYIKVKQNRMFLWGRNKDKTGIYGSYIDAAAYSTVSNETLGSGDGATKTFTGTLAFRSGTVRTAFGLQVFAPIAATKTITAISQLPTAQVAATAHGYSVGDYVYFAGVVGMTEINGLIGTVNAVIDANNFQVRIDTTGFTAYSSGGTAQLAEVFTDDYSGVLTSNLAGTGTINYTTGAYSVTFNTAPVNTASNVKGTYQYENSNNTGITDFTKSATRLAGQGFVFRQDDGGGDTKNVLSYGDVEYCLHRLKSWALTLTATDTNATNLIYRDNVGIPNWRAAVGTGDGVYFIDDYNQTDPKFRLLTLNNISTQVIPVPISDALNLKDYRFDKGVSEESGDLIIFECRHKDSTENDTTFVYDKRYKSLDRLDYNFSCAVKYNGALVIGDSISDNVFELFSGFDDNGSLISNSWEGNLTDLQIQELKRVMRFWVQGEISRDQTLKIYMAFDRGSYVLVGTQNGTDSNVDTAPRPYIGSDSIGESALGGTSEISVYNYIKDIKLRQGRFNHVKVRVEATGIGYVSVSTLTYHDIILHGQRLPSKYRAI